MKTRLLLICAAGALGLAACNPPATGGESEAGGTAASAGDTGQPASAATTATVADTALAPGLWNVTTTVGTTTMTSQMCVDERMNALSNTMDQQAGTDCDQIVNRSPAGMAFTSTCNMGEQGGQTHTEGMLTGDFQTNYRMEADITTTGASYAAMNGETHMVAEATRAGDCPSGWRGGDIEVEVMGQRHRVNIHDTLAEGAARNAADG